jgi:hypothetical protein
MVMMIETEIEIAIALVEMRATGTGSGIETEIIVVIETETTGDSRPLSVAGGQIIARHVYDSLALGTLLSSVRYLLIVIKFGIHL